MIFVTVGTQDKQFVRLIEEIERLVKKKIIDDKVVVQAGYTQYTSNVLEILNYIPYNEFNEYLKKADLIITHGGVGSILSSLKLNKRIVAVPRLKEYKEHINDHQVQIVEKMEQEGYIVACLDLKQLSEKIEQAKKLTPKEYKSNADNFKMHFEQILNQELNKG